MKFLISILTTVMLVSLNLGAADTKIGKEAPNFKLADYFGNVFKLSDYRGSWVVLEWVNFDCPFVRKHYETNNMQKLQEEYQKKGVVWFSICSSASGKQGNFSENEIENRIMKLHAKPTAYLIDSDGTVGKSYGAKTTPHIFIINPKGILIYAGAIDNIKSTNKDDVAKAENYIRIVLDAVLNGEEAPVKTTKPYGCSVKY